MFGGSPTLVAFLETTASELPRFTILAKHAGSDTNPLNRFASAELGPLTEPIEVCSDAVEVSVELPSEPLRTVETDEDAVAERQHHVPSATRLPLAV